MEFAKSLVSTQAQARADVCLMEIVAGLVPPRAICIIPDDDVPQPHDERTEAMTKLDSDKTPQSGGGSNADRLSQSPLEIRRGSADPTDVDETPLTLGFGEEHLDEAQREPSGTDQWAAPGSGTPSAP